MYWFGQFNYTTHVHLVYRPVIHSIFCKYTVHCTTWSSCLKVGTYFKWPVVFKGVQGGRPRGHTLFIILTFNIFFLLQPYSNSFHPKIHWCKYYIYPEMETFVLDNLDLDIQSNHFFNLKIFKKYTFPVLYFSYSTPN